MIFENIYDIIAFILSSAGILQRMQSYSDALGIPIAPKLIIILVESALLLVGVALMVMFLTWMERKVLGHAQARLGPMITWYHGLLQPIVDGVKLLSKEDLMPRRADKWLFFIAPMIAFVPALLVFIPIPFGCCGAIISDLPMGILYVMAVSAISPIGILIGGWASDNKYSLLGALRAAAQDLSYEIPMVLTIIGIVLITGSLSLQDIVEFQDKIWFVFLQPLGFIIFLVAAIAEMSRIPFDLHESESEFVAGFFTEYSGMKFAFFFLAEYAHLFGIAAIMTTLYFGGWHGPMIPMIPPIITSIVWFTLKVLVIIFFTMWLRATVPRVRVDQILDIGWKVMLPLALFNVFITGLLVAGGVL
ncbi:MAG: NADH-quinone oxidoreductase subunit NuoH [Methanosarcinales archaeon]